jgi:hypothetical protein
MGRRVWFPVVSGPLAPYATGFESWLRSRSYSSSATANRLCQLDQFSRWLERRGLTAGELSGTRVAEFARSRREAGLVAWTSPQSVALVLEYLREIGVMRSPVAVVASGPLEELLPITDAICGSSGVWRSTRSVMRISRPRVCSWPGGRAWTGSGWSGSQRRM